MQYNAIINRYDDASLVAYVGTTRAAIGQKAKAESDMAASEVGSSRLRTPESAQHNPTHCIALHCIMESHMHNQKIAESFSQ